MNSNSNTRAVVLGAALGPSFCSYSACFSLMSSLSVCRIVTPFRTDLDINHILPHAKRRDDLFTYEKLSPEEARRQRPDFLECVELLRITSWHCLTRIWPVLTKPSTDWCASGMSWQHLAHCRARIGKLGRTKRTQRKQASLLYESPQR